MSLRTKEKGTMARGKSAVRLLKGAYFSACSAEKESDLKSEGGRKRDSGTVGKKGRECRQKQSELDGKKGGRKTRSHVRRKKEKQREARFQKEKKTLLLFL